MSCNCESRLDAVLSCLGEIKTELGEVKGKCQQLEMETLTMKQIIEKLALDMEWVRRDREEAKKQAEGEETEKRKETNNREEEEEEEETAGIVHERYGIVIREEEDDGTELDFESLRREEEDEEELQEGDSTLYVTAREFDSSPASVECPGPDLPVYSARNTSVVPFAYDDGIEEMPGPEAHSGSSSSISPDQSSSLTLSPRPALGTTTRNSYNHDNSSPGASHNVSHVLEDDDRSISSQCSSSVNDILNARISSSSGSLYQFHSSLRDSTSSAISDSYNPDSSPQPVFNNVSSGSELPSAISDSPTTTISLNSTVVSMAGEWSSLATPNSRPPNLFCKSCTSPSNEGSVNCEQCGVPLVYT